MPEIAMWGAPSSGKTTFLYALDIALNRRHYGFTMTADDDPSEKLLIESAASLAAGRAFPQGTQGIDYFQWTLYGKRRQTTASGSGRGFQTVNQTLKITLKLADPNGELALLSKLADPDRKRLIGTLADADGIIFIFDPIREAQKGDAFETTNGLLHQLTRQVAQSDPNFDGKLPHNVAICVTKFDEPKVLETAKSLRVLKYDQGDPFRFPRVDGSDDARRLLTTLCSVSGTGNGDLMLNSLDQHFHADRVRYFVTSAVGFFVNPATSMFDEADPQNLVKDIPGLTTADQARIRGPLHPINIVEPVLWLGEQESRR